MTDFKGTITVAVVGKTNAGKSTLVNSLVGEKVSIVTPKKQTTRENILGILNQEDCQIVFVDTPGIHKTKDDLGKAMMKSVRSAMEEVDLVLYVVDASVPFTEEEEESIINKSKQVKMAVIVSKIDIAGYEKTYPILQRLTKIKSLVEIIPVSAKKKQNLDVVLNFLKNNLIKVDESELLFERDVYTDKSVRFMSAEIIREKILLCLDEEVPHGVFIDIINFKENKRLTTIEAEINCKKQSHKAIIIGKNGNMLKEIATKARIDIEKMLGTKVLLKVFVKTREK